MLILRAKNDQVLFRFAGVINSSSEMDFDNNWKENDFGKVFRASLTSVRIPQYLDSFVLQSA